LFCEDHEEGGVGASRKADDDRSYIEPFPTTPITLADRGENIPPPGMAHVERGMGMEGDCIYAGE
jgi:hypothetical protein